MEMDKIGHCRHGEFILADGCPKCIAEHRAAQEAEKTGTIPKDTNVLPMFADETGPYGVQEWPVEPFPDNGGGIEPPAATQAAAPPAALVTIETQVGKPTTELFQLYQQAASLYQFAKTRIIAKNEDLKPVTNDLAIIATCKKAMSARKTEFVGPMKAKLDLVNKAFADLMFPVEEADRLTRAKVSAFDNEQRQKAAAAARIDAEKERLAREEAALNEGVITVNTEPTVAPPPVPEHTRTDMGTLGGRDNWKARVLDFKILPDEYKLPNESLLNSFARTNKGQRPIPGVEFYNDRSVTMRTK